MKQGAYDFLTKPINLDHLDLLVARAIKSRDLEKKVETLEVQLNEKFGMENIIGDSLAMRPVFRDHPADCAHAGRRADPGTERHGAKNWWRRRFTA